MLQTLAVLLNLLPFLEGRSIQTCCPKVDPDAFRNVVSIYALLFLSFSFMKLVAVEISKCVCNRKLVRSSLHSVQHFYFEVFGVLSSSGCRMWNKTYRVGGLYWEDIRGVCKDIRHRRCVLGCTGKTEDRCLFVEQTVKCCGQRAS